MKFSLVLPGREIPKHIKDCLKEQPSRSGAYNWLFLHHGEINTFESIRNNLEDYDVLQINMSPRDMPIIPEIRRALGNSSSTKLVLNNDYVCEKWNLWGQDPYYYRQMQRCGDMVFGTEPHQTSFMINGTFTFPHPTNTKVVKRIGCDPSTKDNSVGSIFHWWNPETFLTFLTVEKLKLKYGVSSRLFGYRETNAPPDMVSKFKNYMFDDIVPQLEFPDFANAIQRSRVVFDPNACHTYGRNGVELACWKIPVVGSDRVFSYNKLFPKLTCKPYDQNDIMKKFDMILDDKNKVKIQTMLDEAYDAVEYFNYDNSKARYMEALETAEKRGGHSWYQKQ